MSEQIIISCYPKCPKCKNDMVPLSKVVDSCMVEQGFFSNSVATSSACQIFHKWK